MLRCRAIDLIVGVEREVRRLEGMGQLGFGFECGASARGTEAVEDELFLDADANELFVGAQRLEAYLRPAPSNAST